MESYTQADVELARRSRGEEGSNRQDVVVVQYGQDQSPSVELNSVE
ncbi:hypothetical protein F443_19399 [Phytophthora nicotianae P1569]|uniref:Uncharacterized protein n=1 Tax=Phytophthora nicotianae P1569 TaxID=1317065 RepID=V9E4I7_PHYNI|nr:hypothetical protein F443_19399 [Phytophthora nicotianae P1569]